MAVVGLSTDRLDLNELGMFKLLRERLSKNVISKTNIIDYKDGMLYLWISEDNLLLATNLKPFGGFGGYGSYQILKSSHMPLPNIHEIQVNILSTQIAAVSTRGVNIIELPTRWGRESKFQGGTSEIIVRCRLLQPYTMEERENPSVVKVRWYPGSAINPFIAILYSDNYIRFFDSMTFGIRKCVKLGRYPHRSLFSPLSDLPVDFDFAPNTFKNREPPTFRPKTSILRTPIELQWPVYVLLSNGDVYDFLVDLSFTTNPTIPDVKGPLPMFPQVDDNYGTDASSMIILNCIPPIMVIATCTGTIYHCILLPTECAKQYKDMDWRGGIITETPDSALFVFETIELELGINLDKDVDMLYSCPIHLIKDPISNTRYLCSHDAGVHLIRLPVVPLIEAFTTVNIDYEYFLLRELTQVHSTVEYIVCTHINGSNDTGIPVKGLQMVSPPDTLIVVLGDGQVLSLFITMIQLPGNLDQYLESLSLCKRHEQFIEFITNILTRAEINNQPLLKIDIDPGVQDTHDLLTRAITVFRSDILHTHKSCTEEIERRVRMLSHMKDHQVEELKAFLNERFKLQSSAERLAEKYEEINDKQLEFTKRAENLLLRVHSFNEKTSAERRMLTDLRDKEMLIKRMARAVDLIRNRQIYVKDQTQQIELQNQNESVFLSNNQSSSIRKTLAQMKVGIVELKDRINSVNQHVTHDVI